MTIIRITTKTAITDPAITPALLLSLEPPPDVVLFPVEKKDKDLINSNEYSTLYWRVMM